MHDRPDALERWAALRPDVLEIWAALLATVRGTTGPLDGGPSAQCLRDLDAEIRTLRGERTHHLHALDLYHHLLELLAGFVAAGDVTTAQTMVAEMKGNAEGLLPPFAFGPDAALARSWSVEILAKAIFEHLDALPAPNSAEWVFSLGGRQLLMSAQWKHGTTPMDARREALEQLDLATQVRAQQYLALDAARHAMDAWAAQDGGVPEEAWTAYTLVRAAVDDPVRPEERPRKVRTSTETTEAFLSALGLVVDAMGRWSRADDSDGMHPEALSAFEAATGALKDAHERAGRCRLGLPPDSPPPDLRALLDACVRAMKRWAADTDGVHPDVWAAYKFARQTLGQPVCTRSRAEAEAIVQALLAGLPPLHRTPSCVDAPSPGRPYSLHFPRGVWISVVCSERQDTDGHHVVYVSTRLDPEKTERDPVYVVCGATPHDPYPADGEEDLVSLEGAVAYLTQRLTETIPPPPVG